MHTDIDTANLIQTLTAAGLGPVQAGKTVNLILPAGYTAHSLDAAIEKLLPAPSRKTGTTTLLDLDSFITYANDQKGEKTGYLLADPDKCAIVAIFNGDKADTGWKDHKAQFVAEKTPEFMRWMSLNGKQFTQTEFAEFIEDNLADIPGSEGELLLKVATTIAASSGINFSSAKRLQDGQTQLVYNETINATAGADGSLKIPQTFNLGLRIFKNGAGYKLVARLKYRLNSGNVKFWYELDRPERALEDAFSGSIATLREKTKYTVLLGRA